MKTWIKTSIAAALAATVGLGATAAIARGGDCDGPRGERHGMQHRMDPAEMKERVDARLNRLHDALALKPEQRPAWDAFKGAMQSKAAAAAEHMQSVRDTARPQTALERMERMEKFGQERLAALTETRRAAEAFYAQLDDAQKKTFDERFHLFGGDGRGHGPRHGRPAA